MSLLRSALGVLLGVGLAACQIFPFAWFTTHYVDFETRSGIDFGFVDSAPIAPPADAMQGERRVLVPLVQGFHLTHAMETVLIEMTVRKTNDPRQRAEVLVQECQRPAAGAYLDGTVKEGAPAEVEVVGVSRGELMFFRKGPEPGGGDERDVTELLRVAGDEGALAAIENRQRGGEIDLRSFIDDDEIEGPALERKNAVDIVGGGDPDREKVQQRLEVEFEKLAFLGRGGAAAEDFAVALEDAKRMPVAQMHLKTLIVRTGVELAQHVNALAEQTVYDPQRFEKQG